MQSELRWALLAIGVALIILVVVGVKIKKNRQAGLKEFDDASWHPEEDVLVDELGAGEFSDDLPNLEDAKAYNPNLGIDDAHEPSPNTFPSHAEDPFLEESDVPTLTANNQSGSDLDDVSIASIADDTSDLKLDDVKDAIPVLSARRKIDDSKSVPEFLKKGHGEDLQNQAEPPYQVEEELSDLVDGAHHSYDYPDSISDVMGADDLDVAAALKGGFKTQSEKVEPVLGGVIEPSAEKLEVDTHQEVDEPINGEQASLLFDDEFENQVKKHLEKREAEKKQLLTDSAEPKSKTPEPRYSSVESYEGAQARDKNRQKESDGFKPRYSTVKNLNQEEPVKAEQQEKVVEVPQSVASAVSEHKDPEVIILHIKATDSIGFYGPKIAKTLGEIGMKFGEMGIYHYQSSGQRILSVSNIVKPGYFEPKKLPQFTTPGISMFATVYPNSDMGFIKEVIEKSAQYVNAQLKGVLYDMNHQRINHLASYVSTQMEDIQTIFNEA